MRRGIFMDKNNQDAYTVNKAWLIEVLSLDKAQQQAVLADLNGYLNQLPAKERIGWAFENLPETHGLSSSFGIQAAVMLHLITEQKAETPIILTDTGYLFDETYLFIDELTERLNLNLKVYRAQQSSAWQEARYGKLWEQGLDGLEKYNRINKIVPMKQALTELNIKCWFAGLRRSQASTRETLNILSIQDGRYKFLPIIDWSNKDIHYYLKDNDLPYHPLWEQGYVSLGDTHSTKPLQAGMTEEDTRFGGLKRECGLHFEI